MEYKYVAKLEEFTDSNLWSHYIRVPDELAKALITEDRRVVCKLNELAPIQVAIMPNGEGFQFINLNKEVRKKLGAIEGDEIQVQLSKDTSEYGIFVPEVFTIMCEQDPDGSRYFHTLTPGKQRNLLHLMGKPKSEEKQLEKTLVIFNYLKSTGGNLDFRELNQAFKMYGK